MSLLRAAFVRAFLRLFPRRELRGFRIVFTDLDADRAVVLSRLDASFALIEHTDLRRYWLLKRYLREVVVWGGHYSAAVPPRAIQLSRLHFLEDATLELASVLIHEVTHLQITHYGIPYHEKLRERIERRCVREQAEFLRAQGEEGVLIADVYEKALDSAWWTDQAHVADIERLVTDADMPRWLIPLMSLGRRRT